MGSGLGRYDLLTPNLDSVKPEADMTALMKRVRYSQIMDPFIASSTPQANSADRGMPTKTSTGLLP